MIPARVPGVARWSSQTPRTRTPQPCGRCSLAKPPAIRRCRSQYPQVAPPANLDTLASGLSRSARRRSLADGVGQGLQVISLGDFIRRLTDGEPDHVPAARGRHPVRMPGTQVIAMRLDEGRERAEDGRRIAVDIGERVYGDLLTGGPGALARGQRGTNPIIS